MTVLIMTSDSMARMGLLLTPSIDHLFDRGFITFEDSGLLMVSPIADLASLEQMGVPVHE